MAYERTLLDGATKYGVYVPAPVIRFTLAAGVTAGTGTYTRKLLDGATRYGVGVPPAGRYLNKPAVGFAAVFVAPPAPAARPAAQIMAM